MFKKSIIKLIFLSLVVLGVSLITLNFVLGESCPSNTKVGNNQATLVGEVTDDGGDPNLDVWFKYGKTGSYNHTTNHLSKHGTGLFCAAVYNLEPCTLYYYQAMARNSAGTSYGENKHFTTQCNPVNVDIKANNSNGPLTVSAGSYITISWTSENADYCTASGDWSGSKSISGSQSIHLNSLRTYTFTITCRDRNGKRTDNDSVQVTATARPPVVITKPAIVTY